MDEEQNQAAPVRTLSKEQKIGFTLLLIFAILSVGLGFLQLRNTLYAPFALNTKVTTPVRDQINTIDALRYRDTDEDGLSDYDERFSYHTSPYLYDTYGYGMSDKLVVEKGLPLCGHAGKDCTDITADAAPTSTALTNLVPDQPSTSTLSENSTPSDVLGINQIVQDPAMLRQMFIQAGMDQKALSKISDADLIKAVNEMVNTSSSAAALQSLFATSSIKK